MSNCKVSSLEDAFLRAAGAVYEVVVHAHALPICHSDASCRKIVSTTKSAISTHAHLVRLQGCQKKCASCQYQPQSNVGPKRLLVADSFYNFRCKRNLEVKVICVFHAT